jgi:SAM-dependent methyltransferase
MMQQTGERQVAETLEGIKPNHLNRYQFAANMIMRDVGEGKIILDCACGVGYGTYMLADIANYAVGFDVHPESVEAARRAYKKDNNDFAVCDLSDANMWHSQINTVIGAAPIDAIVSIETIEHVADASDLVARYAAASPYLVASVPNDEIVAFDKTLHPFHFRHYTRGQFEELLNDHGYQITTWATQYDKIPGVVYEDADDGMGFIVAAQKM